jgi:uncharacterized protein (TIGR00369 family)
MDLTEHHRGLLRAYGSAPTNQSYTDLKLAFTDAGAQVSLTATPDLHHAGGGVHGAHVFKLLDDAAYFAVNAMVPDVLVMTAQFSIQLFRPATVGRLVATGVVTKPGRTVFFAESVLVGPNGKEIGRGHGSFGVSRIRLDTVAAYRG